MSRGIVNASRDECWLAVVRFSYSGRASGTMSDDFAMLAKAAKGAGKGDGQPAAKGARQDSGGPRSYLKCFETLGPQMLNAYGEAKYAKMADEDIWKHMSKEQKSGAMWMTE